MNKTKKLSNMKTKFIILSAIFAAMMLALNSCDSDPSMDAVPPMFSEMTITPASPHPGDSVSVVVNYEKEGKKWYKVKFSWSLTGPSNYSDKGSGVCNVGDKPTFKFKIPEDANGNYVLKFAPGYASATTLFPVGSYGTLEAGTSIKNGTITFTF